MKRKSSGGVTDSALRTKDGSRGKATCSRRAVNDERIYLTQARSHTIQLEDGAGTEPRVASTLVESAVPVPWHAVKPEPLRKLSVGLWVPELAGVVVVQSRGVVIHRSVNRFFCRVAADEQVVCLHPEEALFCMERGSLVVFHGDTGCLLPIERVYRMIVIPSCGTPEAAAPSASAMPLPAYCAYAHLRRRGLFVERNAAKWPARGPDSGSQGGLPSQSGWRVLFEQMRSRLRSPAPRESAGQPRATGGAAPPSAHACSTSLSTQHYGLWHIRCSPQQRVSSDGGSEQPRVGAGHVPVWVVAPDTPAITAFQALAEEQQLGTLPTAHGASGSIAVAVGSGTTLPVFLSVSAVRGAHRGPPVLGQ